MDAPARPEPRFLGWLVAAAAAAVLVLAAYPDVAFAGKTLLVGPGMPGVVHDATPQGAPLVTPPLMDTVAAYIDEPLARLMGRQLARGELPLWNPWNGFGAPLLGNMQSALLSPFRWFSMFLPDAVALHDLALLLRLGVAAFFTFLFVRGRGAALHASLAAAAAFALTGYFTLHAPMHHLGVEVWLPAMLCAIDACARPPRVRPLAFLWLFACAFLVTVGGNPEATLVVLLFAGLFALGHARGPGAVGRLGAILAATLLGIGAGAPYLLTALEYLAHGSHHHAETTGLDHYRPWTALSYLRPLVFRTAQGGVHPMAPPWLGTSVLLLAIVGARARGTRLPVRFAAVAAVFCLLKFTGAPLVNDVGRLPLLSMLIFYKYGNPALAFALAVLVAAALTAMERDAPRPRFAWTSLLVAALLAAAAFWVAQRVARSPEGSPEVHPVLGADLVDVVALVALALAFAWHGPPRARALAPWIASFVCVIELATSAHLERPDRTATLVERPYVTFLRERLERDRVERADQPRIFGPYSAFPPNLSAAFAIPDVRSHDGLYVGRYERYVEAFLVPTNFGPQFDGRDMLPIPRASVEAWLRTSSAFLRRGIDRARAARWLERPFAGAPEGAGALVGARVDLGDEATVRGFEQAAVRYHVWSPGTGMVFEGLHLASTQPERWRLVHPAWLTEALAGARQGLSAERRTVVEERLRAERDAIVLEDVHALPRVQLAPSALAVADGTEAIERLADPAFPWRTRIVVEGASDAVASEERPSPGRITALRFPDDRTVDVAVAIEAPTWLLLRDVHYPGWTATVDGVPRAIEPANLAFRAVRLAPGDRAVAFTYDPPSFRWGVWIAAGCVSLAVFGAFWARWTGRRPMRPGVP